MNTWWRLRQTLRRLSAIRTAADGLLLARVLLFAGLVPMVMRLPLERVQAILEPRRPTRRCSVAREGHVLNLINLALDLARPVFRTSCLTRGLTRYYFLRRAGVDLALAFGIGRPVLADVVYPVARSAMWAGHCWLTRQGEPFLETHDPRPLFTEVYRIGGRTTPATAAR